MLPFIRKPPISHRRKAVAVGIAGAIDLIQIVLCPMFLEGAASPFDDALDVIAALILLAVCGFKWQFILAFLLELVPGLDLLPTWTAVVLLIPSTGPEPAESTSPPVDTSRLTVTRIPPVQPDPAISTPARLPSTSDL
jgi:hypothetical protein